MTDNTELLERILSTLDRIAETQDRIEIVLEEKQNRTMESKYDRELMQAICKQYKENEPSHDIQIGTLLHIYGFRDVICKIKNIKNTKFEQRRINKWIRRLEDNQFISKHNAETIQVLDTGADWGELP